MSKLRFRVVEKAFHKKPVEVGAPSERPSEYFAKYVFNREKMFKYLPSSVYAKLVDVIDNGATLDRSIANAVADGMKKWAVEMGVTHYTHWFQPLTEGTAEKHDAFVEHDGKGGMLEEFSGKLLVQQESDGSSFPNGGIRNTFEARGYSAWDPSSPVFIVDDTLCIPTVFIAYTGESLDYKAPLLKALTAVNKAALDVMHYFDPSVKKVISYLGWEQEYFLVDEGLYAARPDLLLTGRTLMGHEASKNQQLEDHYFGAIPTRVAAFMKDLEVQALELGIPVKTRHNEVAPNQFELAPIYEECNLAVDHNMLIMSLMRKVARNAQGGAQPRIPRAAPRKALQGSQRLRQTQQLVAGHGQRNASHGSRQDFGREPALHYVRRQHADGRLPPQRTAEGFHHERHQHAPSGRTRSASRHHLVFPRHAAEQGARPSGSQHQRRPALFRRQARHEAGHSADSGTAHWTFRRFRNCSSTIPTATAPRRSPSRATASSFARRVRKPTAPAR